MSVIRKLGKRRVFAFFKIFLVRTTARTLSEEGDESFHVVEDYADIVFAVVANVVIPVRWKKRCP